MPDRLFDGRPFRIRTPVARHTQEALSLKSRANFHAFRVIETLAILAKFFGGPKNLSVHNGPEFAGRTLDQWAYANEVEFGFSRSGIRGSIDLMRKRTFIGWMQKNSAIPGPADAWPVILIATDEKADLGEEQEPAQFVVTAGSALRIVRSPLRHVVAGIGAAWCIVASLCIGGLAVETIGRAHLTCSSGLDCNQRSRQA